MTWFSLADDSKKALPILGRFFHAGRCSLERPRVADFNRGGHPERVTTNLDADTVRGLLGDGKGRIQEAKGSPFLTGAKHWQVAIDDSNGEEEANLAIFPNELAPPILSHATGETFGKEPRDLAASAGKAIALLQLTQSKSFPCCPPCERRWSKSAP